MNAKIVFGLATICCALNSATAILGTIGLAGAGSGTAVTLTGLGAASGTTGFLTASGAALLGGAVILKGLAAVAIASELSRGRGRRSAENLDLDLAISNIAANEPSQCYRRLICDLATGSIKSDNEVIVSLFDKDVTPESPRFDFVTAAKIGKQLKNVQYCEYRFSCPLTGAQIAKLF